MLLFVYSSLAHGWIPDDPKSLQRLKPECSCLTSPAPAILCVRCTYLGVCVCWAYGGALRSTAVIDPVGLSQQPPSCVPQTDGLAFDRSPEPGSSGLKPGLLIPPARSPWTPCAPARKACGPWPLARLMSHHARLQATTGWLAGRPAWGGRLAGRRFVGDR